MARKGILPRETVLTLEVGASSAFRVVLLLCLCFVMQLIACSSKEGSFTYIVLSISSLSSCTPQTPITSGKWVGTLDFIGLGQLT